jgi:RNA polymerase sigma-70 factor (ECF subfamily)
MLDPDTERNLLDRIAEGDRAAAESLVDATYERVFALLVRLTGRDRELAADLTQDTYRKAWTSLDGFDRCSRVATWLHRIAYNTFLNHMRRPRPVDLDEDPAVLLPDPSPGQDERLDRREVASRLRQALKCLPDDLRFTVAARFWADLPVSEIARLEHVTGAAIRKRLQKAQGELRRAMGEEDAA